MAVDSIQTVKVNAPQFKAAENSATTTITPETKENGNALLYGSLGALGVIAAAGLAIKAVKGKGIDAAKLKKLGYKIEEGKLLNKKGKAYTGEITKKGDNGTKYIQEYKDGVQVKTIVKPKNGEYKEVIRSTEKGEGTITTATVYTPAKKDADYKEITKVTERTKDKVKTTTTKTPKEGEPVVETIEFYIQKAGGEGGAA